MKKIAMVIVCCTTLAVTPPLFAYSYKTCLGHILKFDTPAQTMHPNTTSFPSGYWENGIRDAINRFNRNPSNFRYSTSMVSDVGGNNGRSETWGASLTGAPALANYYYTCFWFFGETVHLNEVDVIFDYGEPDDPWIWTADTVKSSLRNYGGRFLPLQTTGVHELGHGLNLGHVNTEYNVMGTDWQHIHVNGPFASAYMGEDATDGAVFLYGTQSTPWEDVAVTHWKYDRADGAYSWHTRTVIYDTTGAELGRTTIDGEPVFIARRGQTIRAEFTYENNGSTTQRGVSTGYYISPNDYITTLDRRIGSGFFLSLGRDNVFTKTTTLTIPSDLTGTDYWLGVVIDDNDAITERVETNNATYIRIQVVD